MGKASGHGFRRNACCWLITPRFCQRIFGFEKKLAFGNQQHRLDPAREHLKIWIRRYYRFHVSFLSSRKMRHNIPYEVQSDE